MTKAEFLRLNLSQIYTFKMYYGDVKVGILVNEPNNSEGYFIIKLSDIKLYNENSSEGIKSGEKINLEGIVSAEIFYNRSNQGNQEKQIVPVINAKKLVILGAGASHDFSYDERLKSENRPPLTCSLFDDQYDEILSEYPGANVLASEILQVGDVERFFQDQWHIIKNHYDPDLLNKIINTQYYLQHLFTNISEKCKNNKRNNYSALVSLISKYHVAKHESVLITSFNYDTLLEQSINSVLSYEYNSIEDYIDHQRKIILFKPYGSWNWIREFNINFLAYSKTHNQLFSTQIYSKKSTYADLFRQLNEEIVIRSSLNLTNNNSQQVEFLPQLLIPFTDKDDFVMPSSHRNFLRANLSNIEEILIIGWKGTEQVFKELLKTHIGEKPIRITVANKKDDTIEKVFSDIIPNAEWNFQNTFSDYIKFCSQSKDHFFS
jgi:RNA-binding protein YhbY